MPYDSVMKDKKTCILSLKDKRDIYKRQFSVTNLFVTENASANECVSVELYQLRLQSGGCLWGVLPPILPVAWRRNDAHFTPYRLEPICMRLCFLPSTAAWSDTLLIFLYEQLLGLMKLSPMRRTPSSWDRAHSSLFDSWVTAEHSSDRG